MDPRVKAHRAMVSPTPSSAPDGGYAWFVLLSCFLVFGLTFGIIKSFGVFYIEIYQYFETTATGTSWITSIAVATIHIVGNDHHCFIAFKVQIHITTSFESHTHIFESSSSFELDSKTFL